MPRYVAFLRAINVGKRRVQMSELAQHFVDAGYADVKTHIASGNVVFSHSSEDPRALEREIDAMLEERLGYVAEAFIRTGTELQKILRVAQRASSEDTDVRATYVGFLRDNVTSAQKQGLQALITEPDTLAFASREWIWVSHSPMTDSPLSGPKVGKALGAPTTLRNVTMLEKLSVKHQLT